MKKIIFFLVAIISIFTYFQSCSSPSENYKKKIAEKEIKLWLQRRHIYNKPITFLDRKALNEANVEYFDYYVGNIEDSLILSYGFNEGYLESGYIEIVPNKNMKQLLKISN